MYEKAIDSLKKRGQKLLIQDHFYSENNAPFHKTAIEIVFNGPFSKYEFLIYSWVMKSGKLSLNRGFRMNKLVIF